MQIGISTGTFYPREYTENLFPIIEGLGIETCEIFLATFTEYMPDFIKLLKERIAETHVQVYSLHTLTMQYEPELFSIGERTRKDAEYWFRLVGKAAKELNAQYYIMHGPARLKRLPYVMNYPYLASRLSELDAMLAEESGNGCRVAYENVHWAFFNSPEFFSELKKLSGVYACLDIKQAMQSKISVYDYIDAIGGARLKNVHLCDYDQNGNLTLPGKGIFDFTALFRCLKEIGYAGPLMMELYQKNYDTYDDLKRGYEYLNNCLQKA